jgi:hypothetical protein
MRTATATPSEALGLCLLDVFKPYDLRTAWAAARRAIGKRYGEHDT